MARYEFCSGWPLISVNNRHHTPNCVYFPGRMTFRPSTETSKTTSLLGPSEELLWRVHDADHVVSPDSGPAIHKLGQQATLIFPWPVSGQRQRLLCRLGMTFPRKCCRFLQRVQPVSRTGHLNDRCCCRRVLDVKIPDQRNSVWKVARLKFVRKQTL